VEKNREAKGLEDEAGSKRFIGGENDTRQYAASSNMGQKSFNVFAVFREPKGIQEKGARWRLTSRLKPPGGNQH